MDINTYSKVPQVPARRFAVAIDFGTYASGIAFKQLIAPGSSGSSSTKNPVWQFNDWPGQPAPYPKTRSAILYDGANAIAWGWPAVQKYLGVKAAGGSLDRYTLLQDFKLALDESSGYSLPDAFDLEEVIAD